MENSEWKSIEDQISDLFRPLNRLNRQYLIVVDLNIDPINTRYRELNNFFPDDDKTNPERIIVAEYLAKLDIPLTELKYLDEIPSILAYLKSDNPYDYRFAVITDCDAAMLALRMAGARVYDTLESDFKTKILHQYLLGLSIYLG